MKPPERRCVDASEVGGKDAFGLRADELGPAWPGPITDRVDTGGFENLPDGRGGDAVADSVEFSVDAPVFPSGVLCGQLNGQSPEMWIDGRPTSRLVRWFCPVSCDPPSMPAQHGVWFDDQKRAVVTLSRHG